MSERAARSCNPKKRYRSERKAQAAARRTQKIGGVKMKHYPCGICKGFHVGSVLVHTDEHMQHSYEERKEVFTNYGTDRRDKLKFGRVR